MSGERGATCDTSVLVPAMVPWHPRHAAAVRALSGVVSVLPAHVLLECYSVLTRLPAPYRLSAADAGRLVESVAMTPLALPATAQRDVVLTLAQAGIRGGAVYDGLVGATAVHHDLLLLTSDRRARTTYDAVATRYQLV